VKLPWKAELADWDEESEKEFYFEKCPHGCPEDDCEGHFEKPRPWWLEGPEWVEINGGEGLCFNEEEAKAIVRAVNAHDRLVAALEALVGEIENSDTEWGISSSLLVGAYLTRDQLAEARAALALARGEVE